MVGAEIGTAADAAVQGTIELAEPPELRQRIANELPGSPGRGAQAEIGFVH